ncbi:MAG: hypothetical protein H7Z37_14130, partial [Pyrinomonadaceae bacterium]|nr:hypothetical protein [Pyrinomonadaceae bacterium]
MRQHVLLFSFDSLQPPENLKPEKDFINLLIKALNICFVILCLALTNANAQNSNEVFEPKILLPQIQVEQNFRSDDVNTFQVSAVSGQFIEINADQFGVDIKLTANSPNGNQISQVNAPTLWFGREELLFIATETGVYTIKADAARTGKFAGRYNIVLKNQRFPNAIDLEHVEAVRLFSEARILIDAQQNASDNLQKAKTKLEAASEKYQKAGNSRGVAASLLLTGRCQSRIGSRRQALSIFENSLALWRLIKDSAGEAVLLNEIGAAFESLGEPNKSFEYLNQALLLRQTNLDRLGEALTLNTICRLYNGIGAMQQGLETCRKALSIRQDGDPTGDVATYNFFGNIYASIGDYKQSAIAFENAIAKFDEAGSSLNRQNRIGAISNLGGVYLELKQCDTAL